MLADIMSLPMFRGSLSYLSFGVFYRFEPQIEVANFLLIRDEMRDRMSLTYTQLHLPLVHHLS
jgi:hypothetical protein